MSEPKPMPSYWTLAEEVTHLHGQLDNLKAENVKLRETCAELREACAELLDMAESHDPEWFHWPEMHEELRKLGVEVDG